MNSQWWIGPCAFLLLALLLACASSVGAQGFQTTHAPLRSGPNDPATCSTTASAYSKLFYNTTSNVWKYCSATNTWSTFGGGTPGDSNQSVQINSAGSFGGVGPTANAFAGWDSSGNAAAVVPGLEARTDADGTFEICNGQAGAPCSGKNDNARQINVTNAGTNTGSIDQAGTGGFFPAAYISCVKQAVGAGAVTVTATTSTFDITGTTNFSFNQQGTKACIRSDGTNYEVEYRPAAAGEITYTKSFSLLAPTTSETNLIRFPLSISNATITRVRCDTTTATSTATIQLDERAPTTPNTAGTNVQTSAIVCDTDEQATTSFTNAAITGRNLINVQITATANTPTVVNFTIEYKIP